MSLTWFRRHASSIRVKLEFWKELDLSLFLQGFDARVIRLVARVRFMTSGTLTESFRAIIDPGSPNCVIPHSIWSVVEHRILSTRLFPLGGIGGGQTAAPLGEVTLAIDDGTTLSPPLTVRAFLLPHDSEPLLLGFEDFLTHLILHSDFPHDLSYLEFPDTA